MHCRGVAEVEATNCTHTRHPEGWRNDECGNINTTVLSGPGGGGTSLWVRRGCAPVLGSFWPENSGTGVSFLLENFCDWGLGYTFTRNFLELGYSKFCNGC